MIIIMSLGQVMFKLNYEWNAKFYDGADPLPKATHWSLMFNTFMYMTLFNFINCRKVGEKDFNVFDRFFHNVYFLVILFGLLLVQYGFTTYLYKFFKLAPLTGTMHGTAILFASGVLLVSVLLKLTPEAWVNKIPVHIKEEGGDAENDPVMRAFDKGLKGKVDIQGAIEKRRGGGN